MLYIHKMNCTMYYTCKTVNIMYTASASTLDMGRTMQKAHNALHHWLWPQQMTDLSSRQRGRPHRQNRNCLTVTKLWSWAPDGARHQDGLIDWQSVVTWLWLFENEIFYSSIVDSLEVIGTNESFGINFKLVEEFRIPKQCLALFYCVP
jgi:hypothetical protein